MSSSRVTEGVLVRGFGVTVFACLVMLGACVLGGLGQGEKSATGVAPTRATGVTGAGFSGTWKLDLGSSKLEVLRRPVASTAWIQYDGKEWRYKRTHVYADGKSETWSSELAVGSNLTHMEVDGPLTFYSKIHKEGMGLVLVEDITASNGQKAKNTVRYALEGGGKRLVETEREERPSGHELNRWVFVRQ